MPDPFQPSSVDLHKRRVLIVGLGGLGLPAAAALAAAGVGALGLVDDDAVQLSNLHRQVIYRTRDIGRQKAAVAADWLSARFPNVATEVFDFRLDADNLGAIFPGFDFVIDGTDRIASKFLVNDGAVLHHIAYSHAGVVGFEGQVMTVIPGRSACLRCLFPLPPADDDIPTCRESGVIGALVGCLGLVQATEAVKYLIGLDDTLLTNRLLTCEARAGRWRTVPLARDRMCPICGDHPTIRTLACVSQHSVECL